MVYKGFTRYNLTNEVHGYSVRSITAPTSERGTEIGEGGPVRSMTDELETD